MKRSVLRSVAAARRAERSIARFQHLGRMNAAELAGAMNGDLGDALPWIRAAAAHGIAEAQLKLGAMLLEGTGVEPSAEAAYRWFVRAALDGHAEAANMAGRCHENGWGTPIDKAKAADWYRRSAEGGHDWGLYNYAHMLFDGRGGVERHQPRAFALYRRAADKGHARAMNLVARCLEAGWGTEPDAGEAATWYRRSAEAGYFRAQFNHAAVLAGQGEIAAAIGWLERAAQGGDDAMREHVRQAFDAIRLAASKPLARREL